LRALTCLPRPLPLPCYRRPQANGNLVRVLVHTDVTKYLEFKAVDGSYVLNKQQVSKVGGWLGWVGGWVGAACGAGGPGCCV
jgi:hypothetical protein